MKTIAFRFLVLGILTFSLTSTVESQILIKDINPGPSGSTINFGGIVGNKLFFSASDGNTDLWVSDREIDSTYMIGPVLPGLDGTVNSESHFLVFRDSLLVFTAYFNPYDINLYSTNGSIEGTQFIKTLTNGRAILTDELVGFNNKFYFPGWDAVHTTELWESDGTESGTQHLLNSLTGNPANSPVNFTTYNNRLWFTSYGQPWYIDNLSLLLADSYYPNTSSQPLKLFTSSDTEPAYFIQLYNNSLNKRLVKVNPDASIEVIDDTLSKYTTILGYKNQHLIFSEPTAEAYPYTNNIKSLNASTGTVSLLTSFSTTNFNSNAGWTSGNNNVFLSFNNAGFMDLWVSDGTPSGTNKIDLLTGASKQSIYFIPDTENGGFLGASGNFFFRAGINDSDIHLWISDGTSSGTERIAVDGQPLKISSTLNFLHYANGIVFYAFHSDYGTELFYSDGTNAGTKLLADIIPGTGSTFSYMLGIINDTLFLTSSLNSDYGNELYALPINLCEDITCADGYECIYGECIEIDPCEDVICSVGDVCYEGGCFTSCADGSCIELGPNLAAGHNASIQLDAGSGYDVYEWSTGDFEQIISVNTSGRYWVTAYNLAGPFFGTDTINVIFECDPEGGCPEGFECVEGYCVAIDMCSDVACPVGTACWDGQCLPTCGPSDNSGFCHFGLNFDPAPCSNVTCPAGYACYEGGCFPTDLCINVDCPVGTACYEGECLSTCASDTHCPDGYTCFQGVCLPPSDPCVNVDCPLGTACYEGECFSTCAPGTPCPEGYTCFEGVCLPPSDPCANITCPEGDICHQGGCFVSCDNFVDGHCLDLGPNLAAGNSTTLILDAGSGFDIYEWSTGDTTQTVLVDKSGRYWVIAYNLGNSTYSSDTINVIFECNPQGECPEGFGCIDGYCINTDLCINVDCPEGSVCYQGGCFPSCDENSTADICFLGQEFVAAPCESVSCADGNVCYEGSCYPSVDLCADVTCPEGEACYLGSCFIEIVDESGVINVQGEVAEEAVGNARKKSISAKVPLGNIEIVLFNENRTGYYSTAVSDSEGKFEFLNLSQQTYKVFVDKYPYTIRGNDLIDLTTEITQNSLQITLVDSAWEIELNATTGIADKSIFSSGLSIYPNPTQNSLYTSSTSDLGRVELFIYSSSGGILKQQQMEINAGDRILLHEFNSSQQGLYYVQIMKDGQTLLNTKILKIGD